jgi:hypothetical protein
LQRLDSLKLPEILPREKAIKSWGQNIHDYEPEFWEFQYEINRYLKNIREENLIERYKNLHRNFLVLTGVERHVIPINSFLSSWFWYRKEHQTRYEFLLRKLPLPISPPAPRDTINKPFRPRSPNACDILFRYGHLKYMKQFVQQGKIRISPASKYKDGPVLDPKTDDELNKHRWELGDHIKITTQDGKYMPIIGDLQRTATTPNNYYTLCLSCDFEPVIFNQFSYDACVVVKKPKEFAERLEHEAKIVIPEWYFFHGPIQYFDPHESTRNQFFNATMCKEFSYAYQMEYRFLWDSLNTGSANDHIEVNLGPLNDICELYKLN